MTIRETFTIHDWDHPIMTGGLSGERRGQYVSVSRGVSRDLIQIAPPYTEPQADNSCKEMIAFVKFLKHKGPNREMEFGTHAGEMMADVPKSYGEWCIRCVAASNPEV